MHGSCRDYVEVEGKSRGPGVPRAHGPATQLYANRGE